MATVYKQFKCWDHYNFWAQGLHILKSGSVFILCT